MSSVSSVGSAVDAFMAQQHVPGLALAVVEDANPRVVECFGLANVELEVPVGNDSVFEMASLTKHMTGLAIWRLFADGRLTLGSQLSEFVSAPPQYWDGINIGHLLNHSAGLQSRFEGNVDGRYFLDYSSEDLLDDARRTPPSATPGERFEYSDQGYLLLAYVIEQALCARLVVTSLDLPNEQ